MDVKTYLKVTERTAAEQMARKAGTSYDYLVQLAGGHRKASHKLAKRIELATDGAVTIYELRPDIFGEAA